MLVVAGMGAHREAMSGALVERELADLTERPHPGLHPTHALHRGLLIFSAVQDQRGDVHALDEGNGRTIWEHDTGGSIIARKDAGIKTVQELNDPKFTYAILNVPPAIARAKAVLPNVTQLLLDSPSALFLAVKTGRAQAFAIDKPIADYYEAENQDLMRLDTTGTPFAYVSQDSIFLKPGDFKWWLFLDTWVGELRSGSRYEKYVEWYRKWLKKDPPPQRFYDYNKF